MIPFQAHLMILKWTVLLKTNVTYQQHYELKKKKPALGTFMIDFMWYCYESRRHI